MPSCDVAALIFLTEGLFGSGKSAFTSLAAVDHARHAGMSLAANYSLGGAVEVHTLEELYLLRNAVLVVDEGHQTADSRKSGQNLDYWGWFSQCRKQRLVVFHISQDGGMVDKRIREMTQVLFVCDDLGDAWSSVESWRMKKGKVVSKLSSFEFDRRRAYDLYDHEQRAWAVLPAAQGVARGGSRGRGLSAVR